NKALSLSLYNGAVVTKSGTNNYANIAPASPAAPMSGGASTTVEVTSTAPNIETTQSQVTHTFSDAELHSGTGGGVGSGSGAGNGPKEKADKKALSKMSAELRSLVACSKKTAVARTAAHCNLPSSGVVEVEVQLSSA